MTSLLVVLVGVLMIWVGVNDLTSQVTNIIGLSNNPSQSKDPASTPDKPSESEQRGFTE